MRESGAKRALLVGAGHPFAGAIADALAAQGWDVVVMRGDAEPRVEGDFDSLITCPPAIAAGSDIAGALASTVAPAHNWASEFAATLLKRRHSGVIVHVAGLAGLGGWPGWQAAGAAYAALDNLAKSNAVTYAAQGIRVNALVPGVDERLAGEITTVSGRTLTEVRDRIPARRFMPLAALTNALLYLVHPTSSYVSGETLIIDGGWDIWGRLSAVAS